jgi:hypothetical protein
VIIPSHVGNEEVIEGIMEVMQAERAAEVMEEEVKREGRS